MGVKINIFMAICYVFVVFFDISYSQNNIDNLTSFSDTTTLQNEYPDSSFENCSDLMDNSNDPENQQNWPLEDDDNDDGDIFSYPERKDVCDHKKDMKIRKCFQRKCTASDGFYLRSSNEAYNENVDEIKIDLFKDVMKILRQFLEQHKPDKMVKNKMFKTDLNKYLDVAEFEPENVLYIRDLQTQKQLMRRIIECKGQIYKYIELHAKNGYSKIARKYACSFIQHMKRGYNEFTCLIACACKDTACKIKYRCDDEKNVGYFEIDDCNDYAVKYYDNNIDENVCAYNMHKFLNLNHDAMEGTGTSFDDSFSPDGDENDDDFDVLQFIQKESIRFTKRLMQIFNATSTYLNE